jgi:rhodanese-related sulfurtransferase
MNPLPISLVLALALSTAAFAQKPADKKKPAEAAPAAAKPSVKNVGPDEAEKLINQRKDLIVVDVRTIEEYDMAHIPGAKNVSVIDGDFDQNIKELEGKPVLVHCAAGRRSMRAVERMVAMGKFPEIYHLTAGFAGWQEAGKTVVKTTGAK